MWLWVYPSAILQTYLLDHLSLNPVTIKAMGCSRKLWGSSSSFLVFTAFGSGYLRDFPRPLDQDGVRIT